MSTAALPRRPRPIGIQNLREIRERGCYYVDKSGMAIDLIESSGKAFFLSRAELDRRIRSLLRRCRADLGLPRPAEIDPDDVADDLTDLIEQAHHQRGATVVVLVDEYDKPILDNLTDPETARAMRDGLRNLYAVLKDSDEHLRFVFLTGISTFSKFSKVSPFSGLNHLRDITLDPRHSASSSRRT